jgi:uncharacterized protein YjbJ (UPF0337 family)
VARTDEEQVRTGPLGKAIGTLKAGVGELVGDDELAREGRLQQAAVDAEARAAEDAAQAQRQAEAARVEAERAEREAEQERLRTELAAQQQEAQIEADHARAQAKIDADAAISEAGVDARRRREHEEAARLEEQAERAQQVADALEGDR